MSVSDELRQAVENALAEIRPYLVADGGDISIIEITSDEVVVQFEGACQTCTINQMTLKNGVEETIKRHAPEIKKVTEFKFL
ncbi:MAG: NifU family protein [Flavobacteriaceae bacterium]|jgi:Fe-S cluster biogenesis protein NfuA|nr:NifU family protein [Flavobacteriaceae bacterium]